MNRNEINIKSEKTELNIHFTSLWVTNDADRVDFQKDDLTGVVTVSGIELSDEQLNMLIRFIQH